MGKFYEVGEGVNMDRLAQIEKQINSLAQYLVEFKNIHSSKLIPLDCNFDKVQNLEDYWDDPKNENHYLEGIQLLNKMKADRILYYHDELDKVKHQILDLKYIVGDALG